MRPILLKGHTRPLTQVKYNREGDILITTAKDSTATLWWADNGERIGTLKHGGAIWDVDINFDSTIIATGAADNTARLWTANSGTEIYTFQHQAPVHSVAFNTGDTVLLTVTDPFMGHTPTLHLHDLKNFSQTPIKKIEVPGGHASKIIKAAWGPLNKTIFTVGENGCVTVFDAETGEVLEKEKIHSGCINDIQFSKDKQFFVTASTDCTGKLFDTKTLKHLKTYSTERPVNSASISPLFEHIALGGGQDAASVTTTSGKQGKFEVHFFDQVYENLLGSVKGHFGPINTIAFNPDGRSFTSGGEDGYVRVHHFDPDYFVVPDEEER
jgi:translation initiation factor 3 subunit I